MRYFKDYWVDRAWLDLLLVVVAWLCSLLWGMPTLLSNSNPDAILQMMSAFAIGMVGLGSVVVTLIVTATPTARLSSVIEDSGKQLVSQIFGCLYAFVFCVVLFVLPFLDVVWITYSLENLILALTSLFLLLKSVRLLVLLKMFLSLLI